MYMHTRKQKEIYAYRNFEKMQIYIYIHTDTHKYIYTCLHTYIHICATAAVWGRPRCSAQMLRRQRTSQREWET